MNKKYEEIRNSVTNKTGLDYAKNDFIRNYLRSFAKAIIGKGY